MVPTKVCATCGEEFEKPYYLSRKDWGKRLYCKRACQYVAMRGRPDPKLSAALRGRKQSPEDIAKRAASVRAAYAAGNVKHARANLGKRGVETSQWKGDDITYRSAHCRLTRNRGKPTECELCGVTDGWIEWALKHDAEVVKVQSGGVGDGMRYSPRPTDYFGICRPCHRVYDGRERDPLTGRYLSKEATP